MRDWMNTLRRASFRGVPFWVESDGPEVGRRVAVHEISGGEVSVTEDMGSLRSAPTFVSAYVVGDLADAAGLALEAACAAPGASLLILPMDPGRMMHCLSCRRSRYRDRMGFVAYDIDFVAAGSGGGFAATGIGSLRDVFSSGVAAAAADLATLF